MISLGSFWRRLRKVLDKLIEIVLRITSGGFFFYLDWFYFLLFTMVGRSTGRAGWRRRRTLENLGELLLVS